MMFQRKAASAGTAGQTVVREREAYLDAKQASAQRAVVNLASADSAAGTRTCWALRPTRREPEAAWARTNDTRRAGDRTFVMRDSVWTDTRYKPAAGLRVVRVQAFSDAYFALAGRCRISGTRSRLAIACWSLGRSIAVEVTPSGVATLADAEVAAVHAGW